MNIFDAIFPGKKDPNPAEPNAGNQNANNQNQNQNNQNQNANNQNQNANANNQDPNNQSKTPLDPFKDLFILEDVKDSNTGKLTIFNDKATPENVVKAASGINFTGVIKPEVLQNIAKGGDDAIQAFQTALNQVSQAVFAASLQKSMQLIDVAMGKAQEHFESTIPELVNRNSFTNNFLAENPAFKHPAVAPVIGLVAQMIAKKHPQASQAERNKLAQEYLSGVAQLISGKKEDKSQQGTDSKDVDWEAEFLS